MERLSPDNGNRIEQHYAWERLPTSINQLHNWCAGSAFISPNIKLVPGIHNNQVLSIERKPINGEYGLMQLDTYTRNPVVRAGFSILSGKVMDITHTPQGNRPEMMTTDERKRIRSREFRLHLLETIVAMAQSLQLDRVQCIYSGDHHEYLLGLLDDVRAYKAIDKPLEKLGFKTTEVGRNMYWMLDL